MRSKDPDLMNRICTFIDDYYRSNLHAPTQREVAAGVGISHSSADRYLREMGEKGMIFYDGKITGTVLTKKYSVELNSGPLMGSIPCGDPEDESELIEEYITLPVSVFGKGRFYILHAKGTSMVDAGISPGDLVVVREQSTAKVGDIVVALDDYNQNTLKRFIGWDRETKMAILAYENKAEYPDRKIFVSQLSVQGVARHVIKAL